MIKEQGIKMTFKYFRTRLILIFLMEIKIWKIYLQSIILSIHQLNKLLKAKKIKKVMSINFNKIKTHQRWKTYKRIFNLIKNLKARFSKGNNSTEPFKHFK